MSQDWLNNIKDLALNFRYTQAREWKAMIGSCSTRLSVLRHLTVECSFSNRSRYIFDATDSHGRYKGLIRAFFNFNVSKEIKFSVLASPLDAHERLANLVRDVATTKGWEYEERKDTAEDFVCERCGQRPVLTGMSTIFKKSLQEAKVDWCFNIDATWYIRPKQKTSLESTNEPLEEPGPSDLSLENDKYSATFSNVEESSEYEYDDLMLSSLESSWGAQEQEGDGDH